MKVNQVSQEALAAALESMDVESAAIRATREAVRDVLPGALDLLRRATGRVIVSGLGKSGHIGAKIAATLASTGTPAQFVHSAEALHGDSGMVAAGDVAVLISYSGETAEVCRFAQMVRAQGVPVLAMTGCTGSTLAAISDCVLSIAVEREADPLNLAPTASTTSTLAVGDALAAGLMVDAGFDAEQFALRHPGGSLGSLLTSGAAHDMGSDV